MEIFGGKSGVWGFFLSLAILASLLRLGESLRCWACKSVLDVNCKDYFNTTRLEENKMYHQNYLNYQNSNIQPVINEPHLEYCEQKQLPPHDYKYVCLKTITKDHVRSDYQVHRECRMVSINFREGDCPEEIRRLGSNYYCGTCQRDGCNSAITPASSNNMIMIIVPVIVAFMLKH